MCKKKSPTRLIYLPAKNGNRYVRISRKRTTKGSSSTAMRPAYDTGTLLAVSVWSSQGRSSTMPYAKEAVKPQVSAVSLAATTGPNEAWLCSLLVFSAGLWELGGSSACFTAEDAEGRRGIPGARGRRNRRLTACPLRCPAMPAIHDRSCLLGYPRRGARTSCDRHLAQRLLHWLRALPPFVV